MYMFSLLILHFWIQFTQHLFFLLTTEKYFQISNVGLKMPFVEIDKFEINCLRRFYFFAALGYEFRHAL